jgi:hypothetical protein
VRDQLDSYLLLNILLTLLGWLPGLIHAVWVLLNRNPSAGAGQGGRGEVAGRPLDRAARAWACVAQAIHSPAQSSHSTAESMWGYEPMTRPGLLGV